MASNLLETSLTDENNAALVKEGVVSPLIEMISNANLKSKLAAIGALQILSSLPENALRMIKDGVVRPVLNLLCMPQSSVLALREKAANTYANLAMPATLTERTSDTILALVESNEIIYQLLSLINLMPPSIHGSIIKVFHAIFCVPSTVETRENLREGGSIEVLLRFCESNSSKIRVYAMVKYGNAA